MMTKNPQGQSKKFHYAQKVRNVEQLLLKCYKLNFNLWHKTNYKKPSWIVKSQNSLINIPTGHLIQ